MRPRSETFLHIAGYNSILHIVTSEEKSRDHKYSVKVLLVHTTRFRKVTLSCSPSTCNCFSITLIGREYMEYTLSDFFQRSSSALPLLGNSCKPGSSHGHQAGTVIADGSIRPAQSPCESLLFSDWFRLSKQITRDIRHWSQSECSIGFRCNIIPC
jgi:hypothetical protein